MQVFGEMPRYVCHKEVWALKIAAIEFAEDGSAKIAPKDTGYDTRQTKPGWRSKYHVLLQDSPEDLGYYVVYADGYESWSPTKAFEEGYERI